MSQENLAAQTYWDATNKEIGFSPMGNNYPIVRLLKKYFSSNGASRKSMFEIGCFPGRFLYYFGQAGYVLNGIDLTPYLGQMEDWLKKSGFTVGKFYEGDFFTSSMEEQYDVVFSSGFIEHYTNFDDVIRMHFNLVKPGGYLFITAPNFAGSIQKTLHALVDKENLDRHNLLSMDPVKWAEVVKTGGFEVIDSRYIGGFNFWIDKQDRRLWQKLLAKLLIAVCKVLPLQLLPNSRAYSPEIILIARKK